MNIMEVDALRRLLPRAVAERADELGAVLRRSAADERRLFVVGTPDDEEPWHLAAHLDLAARRTGLAFLSPTLLRHRVAPGAPAHLSVPVERLAAGGRDDAVLVIAPSQPNERLLERLQDARRGGALILNIETQRTELDSLAHESLTLSTPDWPAASRAALEQRADVVQHLVGEARVPSRRRALLRRSG